MKATWLEGDKSEKSARGKSIKNQQKLSRRLGFSWFRFFLSLFV